METNSENNKEPADNSTPAPGVENQQSAANCLSCGRALSQTTRKCYYCGEVTAEEIKKLNFIMLDWQHQYATDDSLHQSERLKKVVTFLQILASASCFALYFVADLNPFIENYHLRHLFIVIPVLLTISCRIFHLSAATLIFCILLNAGVLFLLLSKAFDVMENSVGNSFIYGFVASLCACTLYVIIMRIFKTKSVEI